MRALSTAATAVRHTIGAAVEALLIVAIVGALAFGVALASGHPAGATSVYAAGGGNKVASISLIQPAGATTTASWPSAGSSVSFNVTANVKPSAVYSLWVANKCSQNGVTVYTQYAPVQNWVSGPFSLAWSGGGSASCTAYVFLFPNTASPLSGGAMTYTAW